MLKVDAIGNSIVSEIRGVSLSTNWREIMFLKEMLKNRVCRNAGYLIGGRIIQMLFSVVIGFLTARYLGPANYGLISYAGAYTAFFSSICTLGINSILVKELVDHPEEEGVVIGTALGLRAISSLLSALIIVLVVSILDADEPTTIVVVAVSSLGMFFHIVEVFNYWFQRRLNSRVTAKATLIAYLLSSIYKIYLLITGKSVVYFALVSSIDHFIMGLILFLEYRKMKGPELKFSIHYGKGMLGSSRHFILSGLMVSIYNQTDKLMLKQLVTDTEIGYYAITISLCTMWCFVLQAIIDSVYPSIMEASKQQNEHLFNKRNVQLYAVVFYISMFVSLCFTILAKPIVYILYGNEYIPAVPTLRVNTWLTAFSYLGVARNAWIVSKEKQKYLSRIYLISAIMNVILNYWLIPILGATGAAIASLAAQISTTVVVPFFVKEIRDNSIMILDAITLRGILWNRNSMEEK